MEIEQVFDISKVNWLLVIAVAIVLCYALKGAADGFIRTVFAMFSALAAAIAAAFAAPYMNGMLKTGAPLFSFLVSYVAFWLLLKYACEALDLISKLPVIHELNKTAGILVGLLRGIFMVWLLFIVITVFRKTALGSEAMGLIGESRILEELYKNNLILTLSKVFFK